MPVLGAIGIGVLITVLKLMAPAVLSQGETTAISVLHAVEVSATAASDLTASAHEAGFASLFDPPALPQMPQIR